MQARASAATASTNEQVQALQRNYESAIADAGVAATAETVPRYEYESAGADAGDVAVGSRRVSPAGAPGSSAEVFTAASAVTLPEYTAAETFYSPPRMQLASQARRGDWSSWARARDERNARRHFQELQDELLNAERLWREEEDYESFRRRREIQR